MSTKSCLNCIHCHKWSGIDTLSEPGNEGWECKHPNVEPNWEEQEPLVFAKSCPYFKMIDYQALAEFEEKIDALIKKGDEELKRLQLNSDYYNI